LKKKNRPGTPDATVASQTPLATMVVMATRMVCDGRAFLAWARGTTRLEVLSLPMFWWHPANVEDGGGRKEERNN